MSKNQEEKSISSETDNKHSQIKYTVYEIEKLTNKKLTKYKLTKAIHSGELNATCVKGDKRGRGVPNYFVYENDLKTYIEKIEKTKKSTILMTPEETKSTAESKDYVIKSVEENNMLIKQQSESIEALKKQLCFLEVENSKIQPLLEKQSDFFEKEKSLSNERKELLMELAGITVFDSKRRKEILQRLNKIA